MELNNAVALVTGANRGIGAAFVEELRARGARKIFAASRHAGVAYPEGVEPIQLDITDPSQIRRVADLAGDVDILINNAGFSSSTSLISGDLAEIRQNMETNFFGPLLMTQAFAPILKSNGGGALLNVISALAWFTVPGGGAYAASKTAAWSLTDNARLELAGQGTHVVGVYMGLVDTDMSAGMQGPKLTPRELASAGLDAIESGLDEVLADGWTSHVKSGLALPPSVRYEQLFSALPRA
jgi:NAD(P)-dependent dehydrogenase (short-subunit alcohol dehydrogenase family)